MGKFKTSGRKNEYVDTTRRKIMSILVMVFALVYIARLASLQVFTGSRYAEMSKNQSLKKVSVKAQRGNIYDRDGNLLVYNDVSFAVAITPIDFKEYCLPLLTEITGLTKDTILGTVKSNRGITAFNEIKILGNADFSVVSQIEEFGDYLPGVSLITETVRRYDLDCNMSHILGYTGEISKEQLERTPYRDLGDIIGRTGVEDAYDAILRGTDGTRFYSVNTYGEKVESFATENLYVPPVKGSDIYLTINQDLQKFGEKLMIGKRGAIVALNPNNGEVLALVSAPDFDITGFTGKVDPEFLNKVYSNPDKPLFNRAVSSKYPPGSTWKMLTGIAGVAEGIVTTSSTLACPGYYDLGDRKMGCHGAHGNISLRNALKFSCNTYFGKLGSKLGIERFHKWGNLFNFGRKTGIDIAGEIGGLLPDAEYLNNRYGKYGVSPGRLANMGIGQGEILVTPMQLATFTAAIANGGKIIRPHLVSQIDDTRTGKSMPTDYSIDVLPLKESTLKAVKDGMYRVVNSGGTGGAAYIYGKDVCGKTGTAQNPHGEPHALFVCFAPKENPEIAIAVVVENSGYGGDVAAPVAGHLLRRHFFPHLYIPQASEYNEEFVLPDSLISLPEDIEIPEVPID